MKRTRKALSILLTLAMLLGLLLPMGAPAMAVTKNTLSSVPTVANDYKGFITSLNIKEDGATLEDFQNGKTFIVTLPESVKFAVYQGGRWQSVTDAGVTDADAAAVLSPVAGDPASFIQVSGVTVDATFSSDRSMAVKFTSSGTVNVADYVKINLFGIVDGSIGDMKVNIDPLDSGVTGGDVVIGRAASGSLQGTVLNVENIGQENGVEGGVIRLTETTAGALKYGDVIKLKLKSGFKWKADAAVAPQVTTSVTAMGGLANTNLIPDATVVNTATQDGHAGVTTGNERELRIRLTGGAAGTPVTSTRGIIEITPGINVDSTASVGDVEVEVSGDNVTSATLLIAKYAEYGIDVTAKTANEVLAGRYDEEIGTIELKELVKGSLVSGRKITIELPDNVKYDANAIEVTHLSGSAVLGAVTYVNDDRNKAEISVTANSTSPAKYELKFKHMNLQADKTGDIVAKVYGSAIGKEYPVTIGKAIAPVVVETAAKDVKLGMSSQEAGDIIITEAKGGAIKDRGITLATGTTTVANLGNQTGTLTLTIATSGVKFAATPKVEVVEGSLQIDNVTKGNSRSGVDDLVTISIKGSSSKPSKIKVSGIKFTIDRTVPVGGVEVKIGGSGINMTNAAGATESGNAFDAGTVVKAYPATVVNAAPAAGSASFNIGASIYTVDGVAKVMDAAPYIKNGRTYVPVRYLAYAMGITEDNIKYENGVVTLKKGDVTVKLTMGDKNLDVNGTVTAMDVAPETTNGRTMLPARFVAEAFGAMVGYANGLVVISY